MPNLQQEIGTAVTCLATSIKSIREDDDVGASERADLIAQSQGQFTKYVTGLVQAQIEKKTSRDDSDDPADDLFPGGKRPLFFDASGYGPMHSKLWNLFDDIRRQKNPAQEGTAFQEAWRSLTDAERQTVRDEEKQAEAARQSQAEAKQRERQRQMNKELTSLAKRVVDGVDVATTHDTLLTAAKSVAASDQQDGETIEQARARFWQSPDGKVVYNALKLAKADDVVADRSSNVVKLGPGMVALHKRADEIRRGTSMTREAAVAMIATLPAERSLWAAAKSEQLEQA
jgi:hypothetical protein